MGQRERSRIRFQRLNRADLRGVDVAGGAEVARVTRRAAGPLRLRSVTGGREKVRELVRRRGGKLGDPRLGKRDGASQREMAGGAGAVGCREMFRPSRCMTAQTLRWLRSAHRHPGCTGLGVTVAAGASAVAPCATQCRVALVIEAEIGDPGSAAWLPVDALLGFSVVTGSAGRAAGKYCRPLPLDPDVTGCAGDEQPGVLHVVECRGSLEP